MEAQSWKHTVDHSSVEDKVISLFEPDTLVSTQYFESFRRKAPIEPEKMLMLAVLEDAINCFQVNVWRRAAKQRNCSMRQRTGLWSDDDDWIFSFVNVCELLQFNPEYVRGGLLRWKEKQLARANTHSQGNKVMAGYRLAASGHS